MDRRRYDQDAAGELVEVLPHLWAAAMPVHIPYPHRCHLSRRLQMFVDWASALLREHAA